MVEHQRSHSSISLESMDRNRLPAVAGRRFLSGVVSIIITSKTITIVELHNVASTDLIEISPSTYSCSVIFQNQRKSTLLAAIPICANPLTVFDDCS